MIIVVIGPNDTAKTLVHKSLFKYGVKNIDDYEWNIDDIFLARGIIDEESIYRYKRIDDTKIIHLTRDPRIAWMITEHKKDTYTWKHCKEVLDLYTIEGYIEKYNKHIDDYDFKDSLLVRSEDLIKDIDSYMKLIFSYCGFKFDIRYIFQEFKSFNNYISLYDFERIFRYRDLINIKELEKITEECSEYLKKYGYDEEININKWLYPYKLERDKE